MDKDTYKTFLIKLSWVFTMAWRDGYASRKKLLLFMSSIVAGIAAVVSILSFGHSLKENILNQSKKLLGADYVIESRKAPSEKLVNLIYTAKGEKAKGCNFASMVSFSHGGTRLVNVRALEGAFPFYGNMVTSPSFAMNEFHSQKCALVDATLMLQYNLKRGDSIKIGNVKYVIGGSVSNVPGQSGISAAVAPPVFMPFKDLNNSGLLQKGSRIQYEFYFKVASTTDTEKLKEKLDAVLEKEDARMDTHVSIGKRITKSYDNFSLFLQVIAFTALILGCIGVASSINIYTKEKKNSLAILRCLGVSRAMSFYIYFIQIGSVGLIAALAGTMSGMLIQNIFPYLLKDFFPVNIQLSFSPALFLTGILLGLSMSLLFSLLPLLEIWNIAPLNVLRYVETIHDRKDTFIKGSIALVIVIFVYLFVWIQLENYLFALFFTLGVIVVFAALAGLSALLLLLVKKFFPASANFIIRQSLLNLYRPNNQTLVLVVAIGMSSFLISTLFFTREVIMKKLSLENGIRDPNLILFDIRGAQVSSVSNVFKKENFPVIQKVPVITMRLSSIRGRKVGEIKKDSTSKIKEWLLNREYRVTYRDHLASSESIIKGKWIGKVIQSNVLIPVSIEKGMASDMEANIGDELIFDVQGVLVKTTIANIREVDWQRVQTNFLVVFPTGVLEDAPTFYVMTTKAGTDKSAALLQRMMVSLFPNISIVDLRQIVYMVMGIVKKISVVVNFMAFFTIITGLIVLAGALRVSKNQRIREGVLLRTLGASRAQILKILGYEYFFLGLFASITGIFLSIAGMFLLGKYSLKSTFIPSVWPIFFIVIIISATCVVIGMLNSKSVVQSPPLEVLRKE